MTMKRRVLPLVWLAFSGGGVMAAVFLPSLAFLFALAVPLGLVDEPDRGQLLAVLGHPLTFVVLLGIFVLMLVHSAHRFRYTLYDGLQVKHEDATAVICYGAAATGAIAAVVVLLSVA